MHFQPEQVDEGLRRGYLALHPNHSMLHQYRKFFGSVDRPRQRDVPRGKVTDLHRAVDATGDEVVVFSWIEWPDKATCDAAWQKMQQDGAMQDMPEMPFDGRRMVYGGFEPVFDSSAR